MTVGKSNLGGMKAATHEDEEKLLLAQAKTVDSAAVTHDVLKLCGVVRDRMQMNREFLKSGEGIGGGDATYYRRMIQLPASCSSPKTQTNLPEKRVNSTRNARRDFSKLFGSPSAFSPTNAAGSTVSSKR